MLGLAGNTGPMNIIVRGDVVEGWLLELVVKGKNFGIIFLVLAFEVGIVIL